MRNPIADAFVSTPNCSSRNGIDVDGIVLHFTRGGDAKGTLRWFQMKEAKVSAHYVVSRSGKIYQMVMENRAAWHAGSSSSVPKLNGRKHLNGFTIGIEICNWGPLFKAIRDEDVSLRDGTIARRVTDKIYCAAQRWTREYKGPTPEIHHKNTDVIKKMKFWPGQDHVYLWEPYSEAQLEAVRNLLIDIIVNRYPHIEREWVARHQDTDPTRKLDPGPAFPFASIMDDIFGTEEESTDIQIGNRKSEAVPFEDVAEMSSRRHEDKTVFGCQWK